MEEVIEFFGNFLTELLNGIEVQEQEVITSNSGREIGKILFAWDLAAMFDSDAFGELFASPDSNGEEFDLPGEALLLQYNFVEIDNYLLLFVSTAPSSNLESFEDVDDIIRTIETIEVDIQSQ